MIIPIRTDNPRRDRAWMNSALLLINIAVFLADWMLQRLSHPPLRSYLELNARDPILLRYITYAFVHDGWLHLTGNLLALYIFGGNVNQRLGNLGYLAFYLAGVVFAGIGFVLTQSQSVVGASGGAMAVMGAYLVLFPRSNITLLSVLGAFEIPSMYLIIIFFLFELLMNFTGPSQVAHVAHVSGMLFGFFVGMGLLYLKLLPRDPWDLLALMQRWYRRRQYQTLVRQGYDPFAYAAVPSAGARRDRRRGTSSENSQVRSESNSRQVARPAPQDSSQERQSTYGKSSESPQAQAALARISELRAEISEALAHHNLPHAAIRFLELRALDPLQVLSRQAQLDVANQLASQQFYPQAADAYERFLRHYPNFQQIEHVELMLGVIYARYLHCYERAQVLLIHSLRRLHGEREVQMARAELSRIETLAPSDRAADAAPDQSRA